jgi:hypothetical protein
MSRIFALAAIHNYTTIATRLPFSQVEALVSILHFNSTDYFVCPSDKYSLRTYYYKVLRTWLIMRLLVRNNSGEFSLTKGFGNDTPQYAILLHIYGEAIEEVIYKDIIEGIGKNKAGYRKI